MRRSTNSKQESRGAKRKKKREKGVEKKRNAEETERK